MQSVKIEKETARKTVEGLFINVVTDYKEKTYIK